MPGNFELRGDSVAENSPSEANRFMRSAALRRVFAFRDVSNQTWFADRP